MFIIDVITPELNNQTSKIKREASSIKNHSPFTTYNSPLYQSDIKHLLHIFYVMKVKPFNKVPVNFLYVFFI